MISIKNSNEKTKQNFILFTEESWLKSKSDFHEAGRFFSAKKNEFFVLVEHDTINYLIGIGGENQADYNWSQVAQKFSAQFKDKFIATETLVSGSFNKLQFSSFYKGLFLGTYDYPFDKNHPFWKDDFVIYTDKIDETEIKNLTEETEALCYGQFAGMEWLNKPANLKTAALLSFFLAEQAHILKINYKSLDRKACRREGMGAYLAVNNGSSQDAAFTILEYNCGNPNAKTIGLVGKCVLFDTGGISVKGAQNMHYMKSDIGGAAAVMGALFAAAKLKSAVNIVAILPITDNVISNESYLPSDVVTACNGKTIEILNTDAEGRLTLADGLAYMTKNYKTDILIDLATLTGSAVRMFGNTCAPYFSNNEDLRMRLEKSANKTGQKIWNMPLWEIWEEDFKSDVADLKNISMKPYGDCIIAAKFVEQFTANHPCWAHLDIAGVAFDNVNYAKEKAATGYGVELLVDFIKEMD